MLEISRLKASAANSFCVSELVQSVKNKDCANCCARRDVINEWLRMPMTKKRRDLDAYIGYLLPQYTPMNCAGDPTLPARECSSHPSHPSLSSIHAGIAPECAPWHDGSPLNPFSMTHYRTLLPAWVAHHSAALFGASIIALLGQLRSERFAALQGDATAIRMQSAVQVIFERRGTVQISRKVLSKDLGLSSSYFAALFPRVAGVPFQSYVKAVRLAFAAELLGSERTRVMDAASILGYSACSNFVRDVKRDVSVSPGELRSLYRSMSLAWNCPLEGR